MLCVGEVAIVIVGWCFLLHCECVPMFRKEGIVTAHVMSKTTENKMNIDEVSYAATIDCS